MEKIYIDRWFYSLLLLCSVMIIPSCKSKNNDGNIQTAFNSKAQSDPNLAGVSASVVEGNVTLTGNCADEACRTNAENAVNDIEGVKKVVNNIQVAHVKVTDDTALRSSVAGVIDKHDGVQADVSSGIITLRGTIDDREDLQQLMMDLNALHPKKIENQLVIKNK